MHEPQTEPKYTLDELLGQCDPTAALTEEDRAWGAGAEYGLVVKEAARVVGRAGAPFIGPKISSISGAGWRGRPRQQGRGSSRPSKSRLDSRLCKPGGLRHGSESGLS
jgi:hypothetical protein